MKIVIDTNKYSGNFEREMCAFTTGQIGDCGVGIEKVDDEHPYKDWWNDNIELVNDDGCYRPVTINVTPGFINDGMGKSYEDTEENRIKANNSRLKSLIDYHAFREVKVKERIKNKDFEDKPTGWTEEACIRTLKSIIDTLTNAKNSTQVYPSYQSVAIEINQKVPDDVWEDFTTRVYKFAENNELEILDIRLVE